MDEAGPADAGHDFLYGFGVSTVKKKICPTCGRKDYETLSIKWHDPARAKAYGYKEEEEVK